MGDDLVSGATQVIDDPGMLFRQNAVGHDAGADAIGCGDARQALDAAHGTIVGPGMGIRIEIAGLQHIAHGANAGRLAIRPGLKGDVENKRDALLLRPAELCSRAQDLVGWRGSQRHQMSPCWLGRITGSEDDRRRW